MKHLNGHFTAGFLGDQLGETIHRRGIRVTVLVDVQARQSSAMAEPAIMTSAATANAVYDELCKDIASLRILHGAKLSEVEIARRFGVSRQPVRDAFTRLENKGLLLIRPQKATMVRGFSMPKIAHARFGRAAVELEALRAACSVWDSGRSAKLRKNLEKQLSAVAEHDSIAFHSLDYQFHKMICDLSGHPLAFETIEDCKQSIDRLCVLSLDRRDEAAILVQDHEDIVSALESRDVEDAVSVARRHFARLDDAIKDIHSKHADFFDSVD